MATSSMQARRSFSGAPIFPRTRTLTVLATLLAACSGGERGARGGAAWLTEKVTPRNLQLTLDTAAMEARIVTSKGATISAVGEDGTYYTLTIPKGALARDTRIKLIPVRAISGLPFGGAAPAVQLKPDGLRLLRPATLTIEPAKPVALAEQVAFAYAGAGEDAHLYPARGDSTQVEFDLLHFSGYGFGKAPAGDPGVEMLQKAADQGARLAARTAWIIRVVKRQAEASGEEPSMEKLVPHLETLFIEYYDTVIRPLMQVAETDDRMAACAIEKFLVWERQLQLLGMADDASEAPAATSKGRGQAGTSAGQELARRSTEGWASLNTIWENAARKAMPRADKACREQHDFSAYNRVIAIEREAQLTGRSSGEGSTVVADVLEHLQACMTFEVELESTIESKIRTGGSTFRVAATLPATFDDGKDDSAPLRYVDFKASGRPMEELFGKYQKPTNSDDFVRDGIRGIAELGNAEISAVGTRNGTIRVLELRPEPDTVDVVATGCDGQDLQEKARADRTWRVVLEIDAPTELTRFTPLHIGKPFTSEMHEWMRFFRQFRKTDLIFAPGAPEISAADDGPTTQQMAIQVKQTAPGTWRAELSTPDDGRAPGYSLSESGHLVLRHTPRTP